MIVLTCPASFFHNESMFAAAQKRHLFVYDSSGSEVHCVKLSDSVHRLAFLPYHFLLVLAVSEHVVRVCPLLLLMVYCLFVRVKEACCLSLMCHWGRWLHNTTQDLDP